MVIGPNYNVARVTICAWIIRKFRHVPEDYEFDIKWSTNLINLYYILLRRHEFANSAGFTIWDFFNINHVLNVLLSHYYLH